MCGTYQICNKTGDRTCNNSFILSGFQTFVTDSEAVVGWYIPTKSRKFKVFEANRMEMIKDQVDVTSSTAKTALLK